MHPDVSRAAGFSRSVYPARGKGHAARLPARLIFVLLSGLAFFLTACGSLTEALDPCDRPRACEVDGVNYVVDGMTVEAVHVEEIGRYVVPFGTSTIKVNFTVVNNGSEPGTDDELRVCLWSYCKSHAVKALGPGETFSGSLQLGIGTDRSGDTDLTAKVGRTTHRVPFRLERPDLTARVEVEPEVQAVTNARAIVTVRNNAYVASARPSVTELCLGSTWGGCTRNIDRLYIETPELAGRQERTDTLHFPVPGNALSRVDTPTSWTMLACANSTEVVNESDSGNNCGYAGLTVLPNFDALCDTEPLAVGESRAGTIRTTDCEVDYALSRLYRINSPADGTRYVVRVDGRGFYRIEVRVVNSRGTVVHLQRGGYYGTSLEFPFEVNAGTYYLAVADSRDGTPDFTITLSQ